VIHPKISIVTPSFNQGQYIEQTILSIIGQDYPNLEYIIIDGGSTDNTVEIIKKYADRITYWVSEPDKGQSDAINKGLAKCTGEIFNWINSDDYLEPGALLTIAEAFNNPNTDIVCGYTSIFEGNVEKEIMKLRTTIYNNVEATLVQQRINQPAMFYRLSILKNLGGINTNLHYVMDLELWFRYLCHKGQDKMTFKNDLFAHFRVHDSSKTVAYEERFRAEEKAIWYYMVSILKTNKLWVLLFQSEWVYKPLKPWKFNLLSCKQLEIELSQRYLYPVFKSGNKLLGRFSFFTLFISGRIPVNFQNIAMFVKLFIGNIPLRKLFKKHA
jgi:glycosyltransferase involved in cell wall biosynthesis